MLRFVDHRRCGKQGFSQFLFLPLTSFIKRLQYVSPLVSSLVLHVVSLPFQFHKSVSFYDVFTSTLPGVEHRTLIHVSYVYLSRTIVYKPVVQHRYSVVYTL
jgi:hypothetical protein